MKDIKQAVIFFSFYLKVYWKALSLGAILTIMATYFQVTAPVYMGKSLTELARFLTTWMNPMTRSTASKEHFYTALLMLLAFYIANAIAMFLSSMLISKVSSEATGQMRHGLFGKLQKMTIKYFDSHQDGKILSLFTSDLDNIFNAMNQAIFSLFSNLALWIGVIIVMFQQNTKLAWVTVISTPVAILFAWFVIKKARTAIDQQQDAVGRLNGFVNEQINGEKVIITNGLQAQSLHQFTDYNKDVRQTTLKGQIYSGLLFPLMQGMSLINLAVVIFFGSWLVLNDGMDKAVGLGLVATFVSFSQQYYQPITQITSIYNMLQLAITGARRLSEVHQQDEEIESENTENLPYIQDKVTLKNIHFSYNPGKEILHDVTIEVKKGEMVALVGPTGSGKTTVMNLLNRFYDVDAGQVLFDNQDIRHVSLQSLRDHVGIVLQDAVLFSGTIAENIKFGQPTIDDQAMIEAAKQAHIHDFISSLPDGYQTKISDENSVFSTGQKQLMSIARTILTNPDLLILDEATSNVDTVTENRIQKAMDNVIAGRTSFVIAHRLKTILNADKIVVLRDGQVIESGTHHELLEKEGFYAELYHNQMVFE
ncbi:ABC transporter ATP-binding protein [Leuconostoc fallax]|uniref:ABC transporter ATP-binding protein n=1 Tax=Leuconostoc fallax TaxID=1251 RepID=A0A4R5NC27_9LACO|nr:ABC transporter ATP-binding protein [Leuconostoc fallax]MBU7455106.1 ABC transporter ATP-binding protein [Leuconostoc fallax]TDG69671.1 hypothetical protein C5L23_001133 [Leuconostoc fallax]